jgi:hypothetical protein
MKTENHPEGTNTEINLSRDLASAIYWAVEEYMEELPDNVMKAYRKLRDHYEEKGLVNV